MAEANVTRACVVCGVHFPRYKIKAVCSDACAAVRQRRYRETSNARKAAKEFVKWLPLVAEGRRKLVADWYAMKHGAQPEQIGLGLLMAA